MAKKKSLLRRFMGGVWRTIFLLYAVVFLVVLIGVPVGVYVYFFNTPEIKVPDHSVLVWAPKGSLVAERDNIGGVVQNLVSEPQSVTVVRDLIHMLDRAANDDRIDMVLLKLDGMGGAQPGQLEDLARALRKFKASGKLVIAWSPSYDQAQYYLASLADKIFVDPMGEVSLHGYGVFRNYYAAALDKLDVKVNVFRVGKYKSFVEPFIRNDMSPAARAADLAWLNSLWGNYTKTTTDARQLPADAIKNYIGDYADNLSSLGGDSALLALKSGLVDKIATWADVEKALQHAVGTNNSGRDFQHILGEAYLKATPGLAPGANASNRVALVVVDGPIVTGRSVAGAAGSQTLSRLIDDARRDTHVAAMVLRVNSPGGSVVASEDIRRQVAQMRDAGKPVVVSMSGVAASGGYWISMNANQIWAEPTTLTGSIGVFGMVPTVGKTLNRLGISTDGVGTTDLAGAFRIEAPLSKDAKRILQAGVEHTYSVFTSKVAEARNMTVESVDKIAQGRVWSGADAAQLGLVDHLGGYHDAVAAAAKLAGLKAGHYRVVAQHPQVGWRAVLTRLLTARVTHALLPEWLDNAAQGSIAEWFNVNFGDPRDTYARCFCRVAPE